MEQSLVSASFEDVRKATEVTTGDRAVTLETATSLVLQAQMGEAEGKPWVTIHADASPGTPGAELASATNGRTGGWAFPPCTSQPARVNLGSTDSLAWHPGRT
jgi:hypothetical protein